MVHRFETVLMLTWAGEKRTKCQKPACLSHFSRRPNTAVRCCTESIFLEKITPIETWRPAQGKHLCFIYFQITWRCSANCKPWGSLFIYKCQHTLSNCFWYAIGKLLRRMFLVLFSSNAVKVKYFLLYTKSWEGYYYVIAQLTRKCVCPGFRPRCFLCAQKFSETLLCQVSIAFKFVQILMGYRNSFSF